MEKLFLTILNNALVASWIILAVSFLKFVLRKMPKWIHCLLWGLVAIRLAIPFSIESVFSLVPSAKPIPADIEYAKVPQINSGIGVVNAVINPVLENNFAAQEIASVNPMQIVMFVLSRVWIAGVIILLAYAVCSFLFLQRRVRKAETLEKGIFKSRAIDSPFILGVFRPRIYLPKAMDEEAYPCVIAHEKAHIKRGDHVWKPLGFLILTVYWFNPLCWFAYICLCRDIEYACDEMVTKDKDKEWKAKYCQALLDCSAQRYFVSACPVAFGEVSVKDRVKSVINYKKPAFWIIIISLIACILVGVLFMTNPKGDDQTVNSDTANILEEIEVVDETVQEEIGDTQLNRDLPETKYVNPENDNDEPEIEFLPLESDEIDPADENMGVSYREHPINHTYKVEDLGDENLNVDYVKNNNHYIVEGDMVLQYKKVLEGHAPDSRNTIRYIVLTNDENVTWEQVYRSLHSDKNEDQIYGTIIIGIKEIAYEGNGNNGAKRSSSVLSEGVHPMDEEVKVFWRG